MNAAVSLQTAKFLILSFHCIGNSGPLVKLHWHRFLGRDKTEHSFNQWIGLVPVSFPNINLDFKRLPLCVLTGVELNSLLLVKRWELRVKRQSGFKLVWQILFSAFALVFLLIVCYLFSLFLIIQHPTCFKINGLLIFTLTSPSHMKQVTRKCHKLKWYLGSFPILPTFLQMSPHSWPHLQK